MTWVLQDSRDAQLLTDERRSLATGAILGADAALDTRARSHPAAQASTPTPDLKTWRPVSF